MGIIRNASMKFGDKIVRVKLFGYEKDSKFIVQESYISETDLVNIGIIEGSLNWNDAISEKSE